MWKVLSRARDRFARNQSGNVAVIFAVSAVPLIGLLGGAVDLSRQQRYKTELLNAMDSAAVALAKRGAKDDSDADQFVTDYVNAIMPAAKPITCCMSAISRRPRSRAAGASSPAATWTPPSCRWWASSRCR